MNRDRAALLEAWADERAAAASARRQGDQAQEWRHLERAHILSQPMAVAHVRTHMDMVGYAVRGRDPRELAGQLFRLVVAGTHDRRRVGDVQTTFSIRTDQPGRSGSARRRV